jgi:predicted RNA methylase
MNVKLDPERNEIDTLLEFAGDLEGKRLLEIGAGFGRLTWRYAPYVGEVVAIDPDPERIARAQNDIPKDLRGRVAMLEATLEEYRHDAPTELFDMALMSWAL